MKLTEPTEEKTQSSASLIVSALISLIEAPVFFANLTLSARLFTKRTRAAFLNPNFIAHFPKRRALGDHLCLVFVKARVCGVKAGSISYECYRTCGRTGGRCDYRLLSIMLQSPTGMLWCPPSIPCRHCRVVTLLDFGYCLYPHFVSALLHCIIERSKFWLGLTG